MPCNPLNKSNKSLPTRGVKRLLEKDTLERLENLENDRAYCYRFLNCAVVISVNILTASSGPCKLVVFLVFSFSKTKN
jgi:hypothetical protein